MIHVRLAASLAALALLFVGCSDDDPKPAPAPNPSGSTSTTPTPTSTPSATPTVAALTPVETVRAWVQARNETLRNGNTRKVYALSSPDCASCRDLVEPVRQLYADGGSIETEGWIVHRARKRPNPQAEQVAAALTFTEGRTLHPGESTASPFPEEKHIILFDMRKSAEGWLVTRVVFVP